MYIDQEQKLTYYRNLIMNTIAQSGTYPTSSAIQERLDDIDTNLSIFRANMKKSGDVFNVDDYNTNLENIYRDLLILYRTIYKISVEEYGKLEAEVERELQDLETMAQVCDRRSVTETTNVFGKTIFFQASGFKQVYDNGTIEIPIGKIETHEQANLACIVDGAANLPYDSMYFVINDKRIKPYNYNEDSYKVPGTDNVKTYVYKLDDDKKTNTFPFVIDKFVPDTSSRYNILSGKNMLMTYDTRTTERSTLTKETGMSIMLPKMLRVSCYVSGATYIAIEHNKEPISQNFKGNRIETPAKVQKIQMDLFGGTVFNIKTDGTIYAYYDTGFITENVLYGYRRTDITEYVLIETSEHDKVTIDNVKLRIENAERTYYGITDIAIKESEVVIV